MSNPNHIVSIASLASLALIVLLVWFGLYLLVMLMIGVITRDKTPFIKRLLSLRTLVFLVFSLAIIGAACFQFYKSSIGS